MPTNRLVVKEEVATYAGAALNAAYEAGGQNAVLEVRDQMEQITKALRSSMDLSSALEDTSYTPEQKSTLVQKVFADVNPILLEVLSVMASRGDFVLLGRVWESFETQLEEKLDVCVVDVTTAVELDENLRQIITNKTAADLGTNVVLRERIDASILGGIIMSAHGKRIDASVATQLESARTVLKTTTDGGEC
ncbi:MAG: ATP synthase F1 subunit delta [Raoultibacter sp.]